MAIIAPSVLSGDFAHLADEARRMESAQADWLHLDVMDGHFVANLTFGAPVIAALRPYTGLFFDVHLMISQPERYLDDFIQAGADMLTMHIEAAKQETLSETLQKIHAAGKLAALSVKPGTAIESVYPWLDQLNMVLIMTVEPGFGGQAFMTDMLWKISSLRKEINRRGRDVIIQVDGGISVKTIAAAAGAGADCFVAGSAVFGAQDPAAAILSLRENAAI